MKFQACGAYVHIPADAHKDKLASRGELMIFLGYSDDIKNYLFMQLPNNILFKSTTAIFNEEMMPKCSKIVKWWFTPVGNKQPPKENTPLPSEDDDFNEDFSYQHQFPSSAERDNALDKNNSSPEHSLLHTPPRKQDVLPPDQRQLLPLPHKSGHKQKIPVRPDNVYGNKLLDRSGMRTFCKKYLIHLKMSSKWFLDLALSLPEITIIMCCHAQVHFSS